jgi:hypothetical protein
MARLVRASSTGRVAKVRNALRLLFKRCTQARLTDRELMTMRTNLTHQSGWGCGSTQP